MVVGSSGRGRCAFLFFGHKLFPRFIQQIGAARRELAGIADVHVIGYFDDLAAAPPRFLEDPAFHAYDRQRIEALGYPRKGGRPFRLMPGNCDALVLAFAQDHPEYDCFWQFEYDVVFTGPLPSLVEAFADSASDLLCTNVGKVSKYWSFHHMSHMPAGWPDLSHEPLRGFLPVFRASRRLLEAIDAFYREGGDGHHEFSWAYVARARNLVIEDIGGSGPYVRPGNRNRFYTSVPFAQVYYPGTFRWRPALNRPGRRRSTLWHPVKETPEPLSWDYFYHRLRYLARWRWLFTDPDKL